MRRLLQDPRVVDAIDAQINNLARCPGGSALHLVFFCKAGNEANRARIVELLLHHGANPCLCDAKGQKPPPSPSYLYHHLHRHLHFLIFFITHTGTQAHKHTSTQAHKHTSTQAAMTKRVDFSSKTEQEIKAWVESNPGRVNDQDDRGWTLLTLSAQGGSLGLVLWLVEKGADVDCPNKHGKKSLCATSLEIVSLLLEKGARSTAYGARCRGPH